MTEPGGNRLSELSAEDLRVLRERARALAVQVAGERSQDALEVLEVQSHGQSYALPLDAVDGVTELVSIAAVPRAPPFVRGLVGFRGEVLLGVELSAVAGVVSGFTDLRRVIAISDQELKIALLAERVLAVRSVSRSSFRPDPVAQLPFVVGADALFLALIDPAVLISQVLQALPKETA